MKKYLALVLLLPALVAKAQNCNITTAPTLITTTKAVSGGKVCSACTVKGICWSTSPSPVATLSTKTTNSGGTGSFLNTMNGLSASTRYYVRMYYGNPVVNPFTGQSSIVYGYGTECTFMTPVADPPELSTTAITAGTDVSVVTGGNIISSVGAPVTQRGVCWSTSPNPTVTLTTKTSQGSGTGSFSSSITGLLPSTKYYVRAYATNAGGTGYGEQIVFSTGIRYQGMLYSPVVIGSKTWLRPDLCVVNYRNGDPITIYSTASAWSSTTQGAYAFNTNNCLQVQGQPNTCEKLYNYYSVADPRGLCPTGWHVATMIDFVGIENTLGAAGAGGKIKSTATASSGNGLIVGSGWLSPNTGATNSTGFTAVPTAKLESTATLTGERLLANWWVGGQSSSGTLASFYGVTNNSADITSGSANRNAGLGVRCVRD